MGEAMAELIIVQAPEVATTTELPLLDLRASGIAAAWRGAKGARDLPRTR